LGKIDSFLLNLAQTERTSEITAEEIGQKRFIFLESYPNHLHQQPSREKLQPQSHPQEEVASSTVSPKRKVTSSTASLQEKFTTPPHSHIKFSHQKVIKMYRKIFFGYIPDRKSEWYGERKRSKEKQK